MDRNTITGLVLIFAIFIGFSLYNSQKNNKAFDSLVSVADSLYEAGDYDKALIEYQKALQYKRGEPATIEKVRQIRDRLAPELNTESATATAENDPGVNPEQVQKSAENISADYLGDFAESGSG